MSFATPGFVAGTEMMHEFERGKTKVPTFAHKTHHFKAIAIPLHGLQCKDTPEIAPEIKISPVYLQSKPSKGGLIIAIPKIKDVSAKEITIEVRSACLLTQEWIDFVIEHLQTIVENLRTVAAFRKWSRAINGTDASFLLEFLWMRANKGERFWKIAESKVEIDKLWWPHAKCAGSGLFCTREGEHNIEFGRLPLTGWVAEKPKRNSPRQRFGLGPEFYPADYKVRKVAPTEQWCVPSDLSLSTGLIHHGFKVNLVREENGDPTHDLVFEKGKFFLKPRRNAKVGEEFTYNYNYSEDTDEE